MTKHVIEIYFFVRRLVPKWKWLRNRLLPILESSTKIVIWRVTVLTYPIVVLVVYKLRKAASVQLLHSLKLLLFHEKVTTLPCDLLYENLLEKIFVRSRKNWKKFKIKTNQNWSTSTEKCKQTNSQFSVCFFEFWMEFKIQTSRPLESLAIAHWKYVLNWTWGNSNGYINFVSLLTQQRLGGAPQSM